LQHFQIAQDSQTLFSKEVWSQSLQQMNVFGTHYT